MNKVLLSCLLVGSSTFLYSQTFQVDFNKWVNDPLVKSKFCVYMTPLANADDLIKSNDLLNEINVPAYRYEFGWGRFSSLDFEQMNKTNGVIDYKIDQPNNYTDQFFDGIHSKNIKPLFTQCYSSAFIQSKTRDSRSMVNSLEDWQAINNKYAAHWKNKGYKASYYEIWNEPDLPNVFFTGTKDDYTKLYQYGVNGIKAADSDALVGGPVIWKRPDFLEYWMDFVIANKLPVDFISGHAYDQWQWMVNKIQIEAEKRGFKNAPIFLTEWASFNNIDTNQVNYNKPIEKPVSAARFFRDANQFLAVHDLTEVYWAQYRDAEWLMRNGTWAKQKDKFGLITNDGNHRKPLFNAFKLYSWMPVDRYQVSPQTTCDLHSMASRDEHNACIVIWNESIMDQKFEVNINNLPFSEGSMEVYKIDDKHGSIRDCGLDCENKMQDGEAISIKSNTLTWKGHIQGEGVILLKCKDNTGQSLLNDRHIANMAFVKKLYWFEHRNASSYADFDSKTWIARLGTGSQEKGNSVIGIVADSIPDKLTANITTDNIQANKNLTIRIDYRSISGSYNKSVLFCGKEYNSTTQQPIHWGTEKAAEKIIKQDSSNQALLLIKENAPADWDKQRVIITFEMQDTEIGSMSRIQLND